jgi:hypothetical protein
MAVSSSQPGFPIAPIGPLGHLADLDDVPVEVPAPHETAMQERRPRRLPAINAVGFTDSPPLNDSRQTGDQSLRTEKGGGQGWSAGNYATVQIATIRRRSSVRTEFGAEVTRRVNVGKKDGSVSEPHRRGPRL